MDTNPTRWSHQQRRVCSIREHTDSTTLFNLLTSDALLDRVDQLPPRKGL
jgi:hypothetical protein